MIAAAPVMLAGATLSPIVQAIQTLYGIASGINDYLDRHIEEMKASDHLTVSRTGRVLEMTKMGFGLGYLSSVVVIATGQLLLGNTLSAVTTVATAATLSNPIAMTCAATGAIYYGWSALSDVERNEILEKLSRGIEVGIELIKSIIRFVIEAIKELLDSKNFDELKKYIGTKAEIFGKSLSDVTHQLTDRVSDAARSIKNLSEDVFEKAADTVTEAYDTTKDIAVRPLMLSRKIDSMKAKISDLKK